MSNVYFMNMLSVKPIVSLLIKISLMVSTPSNINTTFCSSFIALIAGSVKSLKHNYNLNKRFYNFGYSISISQENLSLQK